MKAIDIRSEFIRYFKERKHYVIKGASLIPENDPTVLFTTAGMHPLVPYLLGEPHPLGRRLVDYQKCLRTDDIEEVGDDIHLTFFEMLGNWSLGDYFKEEAIKMSYDFLVSYLQLNPDRLAVSIFAGDQDAPRDEETFRTWIEVGVKEENIFFYGKKHNWWGPAGETGPCGPDTEIFYDSLKPKCSESCGPSCDCGKYWEIWNNVFMEYNKDSEGVYKPLEQKNIDTGLGLERMTAIMEGKESIYATELFSCSIKEIESAAVNYNMVSGRIIADHMRSACLVIGDGIVPSNLEQGYILRRLIRRTIRHMRKIGLDLNYMTSLVNIIIESLRELYPELIEYKEVIHKQLIDEKNKFMATLESGEKKFFKVIEKYKLENKNMLDGETIFKLYDTFGFPPEITAELAIENGMQIDLDGFQALFKRHQDISRSGASLKFKGGLADHTKETTLLHTATHLLHKTLQVILGGHVKQKGSNITKERLRFDFSHHQRLIPEEISAIEDMVNSIIAQRIPIICEEMSLESAKELNAMGLFSEKYGEVVKIYSIGNFSREICGGPHAENTSELGYFKIIKEEAVSSGVRRIKAVLLRNQK